MKLWRAALAAIAISASLAQGAGAQNVPRIKATILSFDGQVLTVTSGAGKAAQTMVVQVLPGTRYMREEKHALANVAVGNYIGATVTTGKDGILHAQEVHIFPEELRGSSEGVFAAGANRSMIDATVTAMSAGTLAVAYRGAAGADGAACTGRAPRPADQGCHGNAQILVAPGVPVTALATADKSLLVPGAVLALSVMAGPDGRPVTPGLTVEAQTDAAPASQPSGTPPVAKPTGR